MSTIHYNQKTTSTAEQFIAGLTDFGPGRHCTALLTKPVRLAIAERVRSLPPAQTASLGELR